MASKVVDFRQILGSFLFGRYITYVIRIIKLVSGDVILVAHFSIYYCVLLNFARCVLRNIAYCSVRVSASLVSWNLYVQVLWKGFRGLMLWLFFSWSLL